MPHSESARLVLLRVVIMTPFGHPGGGNVLDHVHKVAMGQKEANSYASDTRLWGPKLQKIIGAYLKSPRMEDSSSTERACSSAKSPKRSKWSMG